MRRRFSNKDIRLLSAELSSKYNADDIIDKKSTIEQIDDRITVNGKTFLFGNLIPTLHLLKNNQFLPRIEIDAGAIKFIANGADVMRPGIVFVDERIRKDDIVAVCDSVHKRAIAVGISLFSADEIKELEKGVVIKNIHYVGDKIWNL